MKNSGHRLGASGTNLENTVQGLRNSIENIDEKKFRYWEFDIRESIDGVVFVFHDDLICLLYTSPSPRDRQKSRMPSSA